MYSSDVFDCMTKKIEKARASRNFDDAMEAMAYMAQVIMAHHHEFDESDEYQSYTRNTSSAEMRVNIKD